jgi:TonB family protein
VPVIATRALAGLIAFTAQIYTADHAGVRPPVLVKEFRAEYSPSAMHDRIEGTVELRAIIDTKGRPTAIEVTRSLEPTLDESAKRALGKWRYTPARKDGKPVDYRLPVSMTFDVRNGHRGPLCEKGDAAVTNPSVLKDVKPQFTTASLGVRGRVELEGIVETDGSVSSIRLVQPLHPDLNVSGFNAFRAMKFKPATRGGVPIACRVTMEYTFNVR